MYQTIRFLLPAALAAVATCLPALTPEPPVDSAEAYPPLPAAKGPSAPFQAPPLQDADEQWVETTLAGMTLEEKIGQMIMPQWSSNSGALAYMQNQHVGGFIFTRTTDATVLSATNTLQAQADVPLLFSIDCEFGTAMRLRNSTGSILYGTEFPLNMALAASGRRDLAFEQGVATAREARSLGIHIGLGPVLDVNTEPVNPIIGLRSFGDNPTLVAEMAEPYILGAESAGMLTTFKHYPGHGPTEGDTHQSLQVVNIDCEELRQRHVSPYDLLLNKGVGDVVMTAHVWFPCLDPGVNATPSTISANAMNGILRSEIGYDRVIMSDAFNMTGLQVVASTAEAAVIAVNGGLDIVLLPPANEVDDVFDSLLNAVRGGTLTEARIDESVRRILRLKSRVGLPDGALVDPADAANTLRHPDHLAVADEIARETLASRDLQPGVLPLTPQQDVLVLALSVGTSTFHLSDSAPFSNAMAAALPASDIRVVSSSPSGGEIAPLVTAAQNADRVVIANYSWRPDLNSGHDSLISQVLATGTPTVFVSFGSPYIPREFPQMQNFICGFSSHPGTQEQAVQVLIGNDEADARWPVVVKDDDNPDQWLVR